MTILLHRYGLSAGHSLVIEDEVAEKPYQELTRENLITISLLAAP